MSEIASANRDELCAICREIDFARIALIAKKSLSEPFPEEGQYFTSLDVSFDELIASTCPLCRLFGSMKPAERGISACSPPCHLRLFSALRYLGYIPAWELPSHDAMLLGVIDKPPCDVKSEYPNVHIRQSGLLCPLDTTAPHPSVKIRRLQRDQIDIETITGWLSHCRECHGAKCLIPESSAQNLWMIDCQSKYVVEAPLMCRYVALSYVWSQAIQPTSTTTLASFNDGKILRNLSKVVKDSINLTLRLGFQYLWIDQYCIDQSNDKTKEYQIRQMDQIYSQAQLTIIAAASSDGLPGMGGTLRKIQPGLVLGDWTILSSLPHPERAVGRSKWSERGWTYQEAILSRRRLTFTEDQVSFECDSSSCTESVVPPRGAQIFSPIQLIDTIDLKAYTMMVPGENPWGFMSYVSNFYKRELSFPEDTLAALEGIFRTFTRTRNPVQNYLGVPFMPCHCHMGIARTGDEQTQGYFLIGLCWHHEEPGERRRLFPSWTWAGWTKGSLCQWLEYEDCNGWSEDIIIEVHAGEHKFTALPLVEELQTFLCLLPKVSPAYLRLTAKTIECDIVYRTRASLIDDFLVCDGLDNSSRKRGEFRPYDGHYIRFPGAPRCPQQAEVLLPSYIDKRVEVEEELSAMCVILGEEAYSGLLLPHILVLQKISTHYERIGVSMRLPVLWAMDSGLVDQKEQLNDDTLKHWEKYQMYVERATMIGQWWSDMKGLATKQTILLG